MRLLPAAGHQRMPWKNGGGETTEIALSPDGAGIEAFDWRVSMANVATDGPFSSFSGIDRTLSVLAGEGVALTIGQDAPTRLTPESPPLSFPGDVPTTATLLGGPILDLNVMTRRGRFTHAVARHRVASSLEVKAAGSTILLFCQTGGIELSHGDGRVALGPSDALRIDAPTAASWHLVAEQPAVLFVIEIRDSTPRPAGDDGAAPKGRTR